MIYEGKASLVLIFSHKPSSFVIENGKCMQGIFIYEMKVVRTANKNIKHGC